MTGIMKRRLIIVLVSAGVLLAALVSFNLFKVHMVEQIMSKNSAPPQTVTTATVAFSDWQPEVTAVGSLRAVQGVDLTTEIAGLVRSLHFQSGDEARKGQMLIQLNADSDVAQLHALESAADLSNTAYTRDKAQFAAQGISKAQLDADAADLMSKRAQAQAQAALVALKTLRAPFAGRLGITMVNPGQYLNPGDKVVTLQAIDPVYVDFKLPQQQLAQISTGQKTTLSTDAFPNQRFAGRINAIDPQVDPATRNFQVEATIANPDHHLLPGMFVRVSIESGGVQHYLTLPQAAIAYNPYGATVFLAHKKAAADRAASASKQASNPPQGDTLIAQQTFVTLGPTRGDQVAILRGIAEGDLVVTSGQLKLINGTPLAINDTFKPRNDPSPTPQEE